MSVSHQGPEIWDVIIAKRYYSQAEAVMGNIEDEEGTRFWINYSYYNLPLNNETG